MVTILFAGAQELRNLFGRSAHRRCRSRARPRAPGVSRTEGRETANQAKLSLLLSMPKRGVRRPVRETPWIGVIRPLWGAASPAGRWRPRRSDAWQSSAGSRLACAERAPPGDRTTRAGRRRAGPCPITCGCRRRSAPPPACAGAGVVHGSRIPLELGHRRQEVQHQARVGGILVRVDILRLGDESHADAIQLRDVGPKLLHTSAQAVQLPTSTPSNFRSLASARSRSISGRRRRVESPSL